MKTVGDIMLEASIRLDDEGMVRFSAANLRTWIEEGTKEIARRTECLRDDTTIAVSANTASVTGPTDMVRIYHAQFEPTGQSLIYPLQYMDRKSMDPLWGTHQGISTSAYPEYYTTWDTPPALTIRLAPIPSSAGNLRVFYYRLPATISTSGSDDADTLDVPAGWEDLVTDYVEARGYRKDRRAEDYQLAMQSFQEKLIALAETSVRYMDGGGTIDYYPGNMGAYPGDW